MREATDRAAELRSSGRWSNAMQAELDQAFERAATKALRTAALYERSVVLRRVARRIVPRSLRPVAKRAVRVFDGLTARAPASASEEQPR